MSTPTETPESLRALADAILRVAEKKAAQLRDRADDFPCSHCGKSYIYHCAGKTGPANACPGADDGTWMPTTFTPGLRARADDLAMCTCGATRGDHGEAPHDWRSKIPSLLSEWDALMANNALLKDERNAALQAEARKQGECDRLKEELERDRNAWQDQVNELRDNLRSDIAFSVCPKCGADACTHQ